MLCLTNASLVTDVRRSWCRRRPDTQKRVGWSFLRIHIDPDTFPRRNVCIRDRRWTWLRAALSRTAAQCPVRL